MSLLRHKINIFIPICRNTYIFLFFFGMPLPYSRRNLVIKVEPYHKTCGGTCTPPIIYYDNNWKQQNNNNKH